VHASAPVGMEMEAPTDRSQGRFGRAERRSERTSGRRTNRGVERNHNTTQEVPHPTRNNGRTRQGGVRSINWIESERVGAYARLLGELYAFVRVELRDGRMFDDDLRLFVVCEARPARTLAERRWELFVDEVLDVVTPRFRVVEFIVMDESTEEEGGVEGEMERQVEGERERELEGEREREVEQNVEEEIGREVQGREAENDREEVAETEEISQDNVSIRADEVVVVVEALPIVEVTEGEMIVEGVLVPETERFSPSSFYPSLSRQPQSSLLPDSPFESPSLSLIRQLLHPWLPPKLPEVVKRHLGRVAQTQHLQVCIA